MLNAGSKEMSAGPLAVETAGLLASVLEPASIVCLLLSTESGGSPAKVTTWLLALETLETTAEAVGLAGGGSLARHDKSWRSDNDTVWGDCRPPAPLWF